MTRAVIFDLDDTLYAREQFVQSGFEAVARYLAGVFGLPAEWTVLTLRHAHAAGACGAEFQALCADHGVPQDVVPDLLQVFRRHTPAIELADGAAQVLQALRADGWRLAVLTNGLPDTQRAKVLSLGVRRYVDEVLYAEEHVPGGKPGRAAFDAALTRLDVPAAGAIFVGDDRIRDIQGARAAGLHTVRLGAHPGRPDEGDADLVVRTLGEVPAAVAALARRAGAHAA